MALIVIVRGDVGYGARIVVAEVKSVDKVVAETAFPGVGVDVFCVVVPWSETRSERVLVTAVTRRLAITPSVTSAAPT
jgi:hypothetical protein